MTASNEDENAEWTNVRTRKRTSWTKQSTRSRVQSAIESICSKGWIRSTVIYKQVVEDKRLCAHGSFYDYLNDMTWGKKPRLVRYPKEGRSAEVWYIVAELSDKIPSPITKLELPTPKPSLYIEKVREEKERKSAAKHIRELVKKTLADIEHLSRQKRPSKKEIRNVEERCWMIVEAAESLGISDIPNPWEFANRKLATPIALKGYADNKGMTRLEFWYTYLLQLLDALPE